MLGPSILFFGPPFSLGYALRACGCARSTFAARTALALAAIELSAMLGLMLSAQ